MRKLFYFSLSLVVLISCNKDVDQPGDLSFPNSDMVSISEKLKNNPNDSLYYRLLIKSGLSDKFSNKNQTITLFVTNNDDLKRFLIPLSQGVLNTGSSNEAFSDYIYDSVSQTFAKAIIEYNSIPQKLITSNFSTSLTNNVFPSLLSIDTSNPPIAHLNNFPAKQQNGNIWFNNIPVKPPFDEIVSNGVIHHIASFSIPPVNSTGLRTLWDRIYEDSSSTDNALLYLRNAIIRADSGTSISPAPGLLQGYLKMFGPNFTIFAPTNLAFKNTLMVIIKKKLMESGVSEPIATAQATELASSPNIFQNPLLFSSLPAESVRGLLAYHVLPNVAFTNNFPTTETSVKSIIDSVIKIKAVFGVTNFATEVTVRGLGNPLPDTLIVNPIPLLPEPFGSSDQIYCNGVLHKIKSVLLPRVF